ncbi:OTU domain containing [Loxospora ochrophaea]|nr:OTU domain containing [Loxospora ochrophaea]
MGGGPPQPPAASCEDYNEDTNTTVPESKKTANTGAKRSKPAEELKAAATSKDEASDSGYSSHTVATVGSGGSSHDTTATSNSLKSTEGAVVAKKTPMEKISENLPNNRQEPPVQKASSKTPKPARRRLSTGQHQSNQHAGPPSPQSSRPPPKPQAQAKPQPPPQTAQPRPRVTKSQSYQAGRPASFHAGSAPEPMYMHPILIERHPPPAPNAPSFSMPSYSIPVSYQPSHLLPAQQRQIYYQYPPSPFDTQPPPQPQQWAPESFQMQSRRSSMYVSHPPIISQPQPQYPSIAPPAQQPFPQQSFPQQHIPQQHIPQQHLPQQPIFQQPILQQPPLRRSSVHYVERPRQEYHRYEKDEDYYLQHQKSSGATQPKPEKQAKPERPVLPHAATTSFARPTVVHRSGERVAQEVRQRSPQKNPIKESQPQPRRPPLAPRPSTTTATNKNNAPATIRVETRPTNTKQNRRSLSYTTRKDGDELARQIENYQEEQKAKEAIETTQSTPPLTDGSLRQVVRTKPKTARSSESGSRASGSKEGSDVRRKASSRTSTEKRGGSDIKSRKDHDDGFTVSFNANQGVNVDLLGASVEGRTISLRQNREVEGEMTMSVSGKESRGRDHKSKSRYSLFGGFGRKRGSEVAKNLKEIEYSRSKSRAGKQDGEAEEKERPKEFPRSQSRRSSRSWI